MDEPSLSFRPRDPTAPRLEDRSKPIPQTLDTAAPICRICRGEGTSAEPLFYPCKCSGSIKYVHQDCLMEWLSHSQKKYCELCKTAFRFTKLYAPDMPQSLPMHVFLEHMAKYLVRNILLWLRAIVTMSVWVCWLPYFMRIVWAFMFWISDEGLGAGHFMSRQSAGSLNEGLLDPRGTCPARTVFDEAAFSYSDKITFLHSAGVSLAPTLLSEVDFLKNLTRSSTMNRTLITVIEGQIITILVIVCFILVILVRDYVVQQQPEINMRAAFADQEHNPAPHPQPHEVDVAVDDRQRADDDEDEDEDGDGDGDSGGVGNDEPGRLETAGEMVDASVQAYDGSEDDMEHYIQNTASIHLIGGNGPNGVAEPSQSASEIAAGIQELTDQEAANTMDDYRASVSEHLRIYHQAGGNYEKILEIIEREGVDGKARYRVDVARQSNGESDGMLQEVGTSDAQQVTQSTVLMTPATDLKGVSSQSTVESHQEPEWFDEQLKDGKARDYSPMNPDLAAGPSVADSESIPGPSRPRARSDGPEVHANPNPLANNSWSFASLPATGEADGERPGSIPIALTDGPATNPAVGGNIELGHHQTISDASHHSESSEENGFAVDDIDSLRAITDENETAAAADLEQIGLLDRVAHFMWGDLDHRQDVEDHQHVQEPDDLVALPEAVREAVAAEGPWPNDLVAEPVEVNGDADGDVIGVANENANEGANAGLMDGAAGAGMDAEAIEDLEDFEGVMELLGMRGPIAGLFQNAIFCAVLVSVTIFACIFIPYNIGRVSLWIVANPIHLVRAFMGLSRILQDSAMMVLGFASWCSLNIVDMFTSAVGGVLGVKIVLARKAAWAIWTGAGSRVVEYAFMDFPLTASEIQNFSAVSHEALNSVKGNIGWTIGLFDRGLVIFSSSTLAALVDGRFIALASATMKSLFAASVGVAAALSDPHTWVIDLGEIEMNSLVDPSLAHWSGLDRFWAILAGYMTLFSVGALYLKRGSPFSRGDIMQAWEAGVIDTLHQASGIMKVILIISIEMLVFPLYCGMLLDGALLPLFESTTFTSRLLFTYNYPLTSIFVHWFVGTGYMFHFALFVSMCRKIMRPGVLYFIRDPDDPEFHPVRDVLERSLATQLRKILFSAFVYGALVVICLGGVVWGLYYAMPGVLPVHYSSNEPVLEFPVDLLFYNFLMPLAVKFFKPSDGLHAMYTWWFRKCARGLRLTCFLFGERRIDEEGILKLDPQLQGQVPSHKSFFLELDDDDNQVIPKTWRDLFDGGDSRPNPSYSKTQMRDLKLKKSHLIYTGQLETSGRFVRAPASDRLKIPKGQKVFLPVSERNHRKDGKPDYDFYASGLYQLVYVPPNFRARIFLFILFIWLFAAVTGVAFTIAPLVLGRSIFNKLIPAHIRTNDIYAFSIGIYVLGTVAYSTFRLRFIKAKFRDWSGRISTEIANGRSSRRIFSALIHGVKLSYAYLFLVVVFPLVVSALMELYVSIPLHSYMNPPRRQQEPAAVQSRDGDAGRHTVRVIQSWTLGLLYLKLAARMITSFFPGTRAATAVRSVMRRGYMNPDVEVLTRAFIIPGILLSLVAVFGPPLVASILIRLGVFVPEGADLDGVILPLVYRHSYPAAAVAVIAMRYAIGLSRTFQRWTASVRDEAYLIGERLHNFGAATAGSRKARRAWGAATGGRL